MARRILTRLRAVAIWAASTRIRRVGRIVTCGAFVLLLFAPLWSLRFGPRGGALLVDGDWGILLLVAVACLGIVTCGGFEQLDPITARLGRRLRRPGTAMLAELWGCVGGAAIAAGNVVVNLASPAPGRLGDAAMITLGLAAVTPPLALYVMDWVRTRQRSRHQAGDMRSETPL